MVDLRSLSLKQLRALRAVAEAGSLTAAAQQLSVTPPAIATHIKTLEALASGPVLDRTGEGARATALGRELLQCAAEMETALERTERRLLALQNGTEGHVTFGVVSTGKYFAPAIVAAYRRRSPHVKVDLKVGNRSEIIAGLERNAYDLVIMGRPPPHIDVRSRVFGEHPYVFIAWPGHPLAAKSALQAEDILRETFLTREAGSGTRSLNDRLLDRLGDGKPCEIVEMSSNETIKQAVIAGLGVALISAHTCEAELAAGRLVTLATPEAPIMRQWHVLHRADRPLDAAAQSLRVFIEEEGASLLPKPPKTPANSAIDVG